MTRPNLKPCPACGVRQVPAGKGGAGPVTKCIGMDSDGEYLWITYCERCGMCSRTANLRKDAAAYWNQSCERAARFQKAPNVTEEVKRSIWDDIGWRSGLVVAYAAIGCGVFALLYSLWNMIKIHLS